MSISVCVFVSVFVCKYFQSFFKASDWLIYTPLTVVLSHTYPTWCIEIGRAVEHSGLWKQPRNEEDLKNEDNLKDQEDLKHQDYLVNKDNLKNEDDLINEGDLKNKDDFKNEDDLKNKDNIKNEDSP